MSQWEARRAKTERRGPENSRGKEGGDFECPSAFVADEDEARFYFRFDC